MLLLWSSLIFKDRLRGKGLDTCYSAANLSWIHDQQRVLISEAVDDWHDGTKAQYAAIHCPRKLANWTCSAVCSHTTATVSHTPSSLSPN